MCTYARVLTAQCTLQSVAFGMGGGLLQKVNRDTMSFATKLSHITYADGTEADLMKLPKSDTAKSSLPGIMAVKRVNGVPTAFPAEGGHVSADQNLLQVMWNKGPVKVVHGAVDACEMSAYHLASLRESALDLAVYYLYVALCLVHYTDHACKLSEAHGFG